MRKIVVLTGTWASYFKCKPHLSIGLPNQAQGAGRGLQMKIQMDWIYKDTNIILKN